MQGWWASCWPSFPTRSQTESAQNLIKTTEELKEAPRVQAEEEETEAK
jgi:hypothetical protein